MEFLYGLDNARYAEFKAEVVNEMQKGTSASLDDFASRRVVVKTGKDAGGGATFATADKGFKPKGTEKADPDKNADNDSDDKAAKLAACLAKMKCFNCGGKGHPAKNCPHKGKDKQEIDPPMAGLTLDVVCGASRTERLHGEHEVCIDNGSQVNIVHPSLLTNLREESRGFRGISGSSGTTRVGMLEGFFECQVCDTCPTSILIMSDVEDLYEITYVQGNSITVHMDHADVVFKHRDKMYMADFSDWIADDRSRAD